VEKRLRKIVKGEQANLRLLEKQEVELEKALAENTRLLEDRLGRQSPVEVKIEKEVNKLREKLETLNLELDRYQDLRLKSAEPFKQRDQELREKLKLVQLQLATVQGMRERTFSDSSIDTSAPSLAASSVNVSSAPAMERRFSYQLEIARREPQSDSDYSSNPGTPQMSQPPPYSDDLQNPSP